jgi:flagellar biosynthesis/type III secretory pathway protein FliH
MRLRSTRFSRTTEFRPKEALLGDCQITAGRQERNVAMPYVTSAERFGIEKGLQQGLQQGRQEGRQEEGRQEEAVVFLQRLLTHRFGRLPDAVCARLTSASIEQLETWMLTQGFRTRISYSLGYITV